MSQASEQSITSIKLFIHGLQDSVVDKLYWCGLGVIRSFCKVSGTSEIVTFMITTWSNGFFLVRNRRACHFGFRFIGLWMDRKTRRRYTWFQKEAGDRHKRFCNERVRNSWCSRHGPASLYEVNLLVIDLVLSFVVSDGGPAVRPINIYENDC